MGILLHIAVRDKEGKPVQSVNIKNDQPGWDSNP